LVAVALIAFASFTIVSVDAFRKDDEQVSLAQDSGSGGYSLVAESLLPLHWDPETPEGRDAFNLPFPEDDDWVPMRFQAFRLRPGDDASCLNLYRPQNPRVLSASESFIDDGRFRFAATLAETAEELANPWLLLRRTFADGAVPVIGDQNSMTYVLHLGLGEDFLLPRIGQSPLRLRLVATLSDSIFQSELLMAEEYFLDYFGGIDGFRWFLIETEADAAAVSSSEELLESRLGDFGFDAQSTSSKLASFHRVENTYLSTFQSLGGLGLVLGTLGLSAVILRNLLERRRELALLRAVGYARGDFSNMVVAENALLLALGLGTGALSASLSIAPAILARGGEVGGASLPLLLLAVIGAGVVSSSIAVAACLRMPLLDSLRSE
jgi:hypothetical protein